MLRSLAERLARGRVIRRSIEVAGKRYPIHVTPDAQLKYLKLGNNAFDRDLVELALAELAPDSIVWDLGANVGTFSVAAAAVARRGRIVAVEPDIWLAEILSRTAREPVYAGRMSILPCAVADRCGTAEFAIARRGRASNALIQAGGRESMGGIREKRLVPMLSCDQLLQTLPAPDFVKIDVEGAEVLVLDGAEKLLGKIRPRIYIESSEETAPGVKSRMEFLGYRLRNPDASRILPFNSLFDPA